MKNLLKLMCLMTLAALSLAAADPFLGVWKLNLGKSRTMAKNPPPPPKSLVATYARQGEDIKVSTELTLADGTKRNVEHLFRCDGKDYPRAAPGETETC